MEQDNTTGLLVRGVGKSFPLPAGEVEVLRGVDLELAGGQALALTGPSGSGKSTLLHLIGMLDRPSSGKITLDGQDPWSLSEVELARFRNQTVGFVFQDANLLPQYSVLENVLLPTLAFRGGAGGARDRALELLRRVGLQRRIDHRPAELSGGERQRAAVARALINQPALLLCDEPTGSLDHATADAVASLLFDLHSQEANMLLVVTHSLELAARFERRFELREGRCAAA
jgi:lipoprotein-releasing system ATP-binding protein